MKNIFLLLLLIVLGYSSKAQLCFVPNASYSTNANPVNIVAVDFNNDGKKDLAVPNKFDNSISIFFGDGSGLYPTSTTINLFSNSPEIINCGFFNNDAFIDMAFTSGNNVHVLLNNGSGGFSSFSTFGAGFAGPSFMTNGDFNSDTFNDLVVVNYNNANISLYLGNGAGGFTYSNSFSTEAAPNDIKSSDFNADGVLDLVLANEYSNNISVMFGDGAGNFAARVNYSTASSKPFSSFTLDADLDGDKDLVVANYYSDYLSLFLNDGAGVFASAIQINAGVNSGGKDISVADFNNDGIMDVSVPVFQFGRVYILFGNGTGGFGAPMSFDTDAGPAYICTGDFNNDGKADIATSNTGSNSISVLLNDDLPVVHAVASDTVFCEGTIISLSATGATTYTWSPSVFNLNSHYAVGTVTYTVTGTIAGCTDSDTLTIVSRPLPTVTAPTDYTVCAGESVTLTATGNAASYTWTDGVINGVPFVPVNSFTFYTITATSSFGCTSTAVMTGRVTPLPVPIISTSTLPACIGTPYLIDASTSHDNHESTPGLGLYSWTGPSLGAPAGTTPNATSTEINASGTYTLTLTSNNNTFSNVCSDTETVTINFLPIPTVTASATTSLACLGSGVVFSGGGANTYTWSNGVSDNVPFNVTTPQTYTVTGTANTGCTDTATVFVDIYQTPTPEICMVTVDDLGNNNIVYWDKTPYLSADSFYVYREVSNNNYQVIGRVGYNELSQFVDTVRAQYFPNTGNPRVSSYRYKLAIKDTCGNVGPKSLYHGTMFLQDQLNGNFNWSHYEIEGQALPIPALSFYLFLRDNDYNGVFETTIGGTSNNSATDPQYLTYKYVADWRVETQWSISCNPTLRLANDDNNEVKSVVVKSKSNVRNNRTTGIKSVSGDAGFKLTVYPNPATDKLNIELDVLDENKIHVSIENILGQVVYSNTIETKKSEIDISNIKDGVYFVKVKSQKGTRVEKIIIE